MKIAVASENKDKEGMISERGARASYVLIFENKKFVEAIKNPFAVGGGGAGWSVAHMLAEKKVEIFVAGKVGHNMQRALEEKKIKFKEASGKVGDFIKS